MNKRAPLVLGTLLLGLPALVAAAQGDDLPLSKDDLFGLGKETKTAQPGSAPAVTSPSTPPESRDALFGLEPAPKTISPAVAPAAPGAAQAVSAEPVPASRDALFGAEPPSSPVPKPTAVGQPKDSAPPPETAQGLFGVPAKAPAMAGNGTPAGKKPGTTAAGGTWHGFAQTELGYVLAKPEHWSKVMGRLQLGTQGRLGGNMRWKAGGRLDYNAVYDLTDHYSDAVRNDQRAEFRLGETYLDFAAGGWDWRVGRQHVVWGEMVGLFFADVVSAKDLREHLLPDFQMIRIPQWAVRSEYFGDDDFHAEVVWIPFPSFDEIGRPFSTAQSGAGSDFYPYPLSPAGIPSLRAEQKPGYALDHSNFGVRLSKLTGGWDLSGFYYTSMDSAATYLRDAVAKDVFTPVHGRIWQGGGSLAKDLGSFVLKAEAVYSHGRRYNVVNLTDSDGVVKQNTLDWAVGLDFNPDADTRLNTQFFQRVYFDHDPDINFDQFENGFSVLLHHDFPRKWEAEVLLISSLNRRDWLLRPKVAWRFQPNWRLSMGLDIFDGPTTGIFGQYDAQDRVYTELKYDF